MAERESRPRDRFLYEVTLPDGRSIQRSSSKLFLEDLRLGLGLRPTTGLQTALSVTLPTATGPGGYGRGVPSLNLLNTVGAVINPRVTMKQHRSGLYPGTATWPHSNDRSSLRSPPAFGSLLWSTTRCSPTLLYHSPYYHTAPLAGVGPARALLGFGWIVKTRNGREWRLGMTRTGDGGTRGSIGVTGGEVVLAGSWELAAWNLMPELPGCASRS